MPPIPKTAALLPVTVDIVALTVVDESFRVLLIDRALDPYRGMTALPGGFVLAGEAPADAAMRELHEETGMETGGHLEQLRTYGPLGRDPRGPVLCVAHLLFAPAHRLPRCGGDATAARWHDVDPLGSPSRLDLAFDHSRILADGIERARTKIEYSPMAAAFCPPEFTIAQLRGVYEAVWGVKLDPRNFHRKATRTAGFLEPTGRVADGLGRPAALYRLIEGLRFDEPVLDPPLTRPKPDTRRR